LGGIAALERERASVIWKSRVTAKAVQLHEHIQYFRVDSVGIAEEYNLIRSYAVLDPVHMIGEGVGLGVVGYKWVDCRHLGQKIGVVVAARIVLADFLIDMEAEEIQMVEEEDVVLGIGSDPVPMNYMMDATGMAGVAMTLTDQDRVPTAFGLGFDFDFDRTCASRQNIKADRGKMETREVSTKLKRKVVEWEERSSEDSSGWKKVH
jgi:hypothetical protein